MIKTLTITYEKSNEDIPVMCVAENDTLSIIVIKMFTGEKSEQLYKELTGQSEKDNTTGEWIWDGNRYKCSRCGHYPWRINTEEHDEAFVDLKRENAYKFCPHCGIKMKSEE